MSISDITKPIIGFLNSAQKEVEKIGSKLASGKRINTANDDPAGLAVAMSLLSDSTVYRTADQNTSYGASLINIAESGLNTVNDITSRQRELATQAANGVYSDEQRAALNAEYQSLEQEKQRTMESLEFNGMKVFNNSSTTIQVGADGTASSQIGIPSMNTTSLSAGVTDISSVENARQAVDDLSSKQESIASLRGEMGAAMSRLDAATESARNSAVETASAASRIEDADIAQESANYTAANIRENASTAIMAQANQSAKVVLDLLK